MLFVIFKILKSPLKYSSVMWGQVFWGNVWAPI